jgi:hypothetical protein
MEQVTLDSAFEQIFDAVVARVNAECRVGGKLADVTTVIGGDRTRKPKDLPMIQVSPDLATPNATSVSLAEEWTLPIGLVAYIKDVNDTEIGFKEARKLAAKARSSVLSKWSVSQGKYIPSRHLDLDFVSDTRSGAFGLTGKVKEDGSIFASVAFVNVRFMTRE